MSLRVLVVEGDREIGALMQSSLSVEGFDVQTAQSLSQANAMLRRSPPDVIVLDLGLPDGDGVQLVHEVRERLTLPIIVMSARHQEARRIRLLDAGADDYLTKPFGVGELLARIRGALRHRGTAPATTVTVHEVDDLCIDLATGVATRDGESLRLIPIEFKLLARLMRSAGKVVTHRQLLADIWGPEHAERTHYLRLHMAQLRAKIERDPAEPRHLLSELGVGYRLAAE